MLNPSRVVSAMRRARRSEGLSAQGLSGLQRRKLRELVGFAAAHSPFYGRLYASIDPSAAALADLPPVTKEMIQGHFDEVVTDGRLKLAEVQRFCREGAAPFHLGAFAVLLTSGTTGRRGHYVWDAAALADAIAVGHRQSNRSAAPLESAPQRLAAVVQADAHDAANVLLSMIPERAGAKRIIDIRQDFSSICRQLEDFQPTQLASYPYLLRLLGEAVLEGRLRIAPERLTSSADVLAPSDRALLRAAFHVEPHDYYCSTEVPYLAWECDAHQGLHVNADYVIVESVDSAGRPVPPGRLGDKVLVTNLSNRVMPLVRYEMSDQVEYTTGRCSCGCPLPRIRTVAGRVEHILALPDGRGGRVRVIEEYVDDFVGGLEGVAGYQIIQEGPSCLIVNFVSHDPGRAAGVSERIQDALARCFEKYGVDRGALGIELRPVHALSPLQPGSAKVCRFWNRCR